MGNMYYISGILEEDDDEPSLPRTATDIDDVPAGRTKPDFGMADEAENDVDFAFEETTMIVEEEPLHQQEEAPAPEVAGMRLAAADALPPRQPATPRKTPKRAKRRTVSRKARRSTPMRRRARASARRSTAGRRKRVTTKKRVTRRAPARRKAAARKRGRR